MSILGINAKLSKKINRELVLKIIYNRRPISRADIATITGLTPASITKIIDEFLDIGLVYEIGRDKSSYGRKPVLIDINSDSFYIIGIYTARKSISGIITDLNADIQKKVVYEKPYLRDPDLSKVVMNLIEELLKASKISIDKILGIGMAVPGPINAKKGEIINEGLDEKPPYSWERVPLTESVSEKFGIPVFADNCSNTIALGESWFGNGMNYRNFVVLSFGEGVGGGLVLKSRLYRGEDDIVGEIGHTTIDVNGPRCECGNYGCLELFVKNKAIIEKYNSLVKKYPDSKLAKINIKKVEDIYNYKDKNDPIYNEIINHLANYLGIGAVNLVNILNPEAIIIGTNELEDIEMDTLIEKITEIVRNRAYSVVRNKVKVIPGKLKSNAQLIGSISLVLRDFFKLDSFKQQRI
jgi:predicted NBD/HSP70 family sugar kinase